MSMMKKIAANEPDMTFEMNEADLAVCEKNQINQIDEHRAVSGRHGSVSVLGGTDETAYLYCRG